MMSKRRTCWLIAVSAAIAGGCACTPPTLWAGSDPVGEGVEATPDPIQPPDRADQPQASAPLIQDSGKVKPVEGTGCIIDSQGRVTRLRYETGSAPFDWKAWRERVELFEERRAAARAENERLRLQWIAEERARAREEAARDSAAPTAAPRNDGGVPGWIIAGPSGGGHRPPPHRPRPPGNTVSKPRRERPQPIFLPTPNITSPFPHSSTRDPNSVNRSFLP